LFFLPLPYPLLKTFFCKKGFGWANTAHFIDPTTGVAVVFDMQALPTMDISFSDYLARFESVLYKGLE